MRSKKMTAWDGTKEREFAISTFNALEQLQFSEMQGETDKAQKEIDDLNEAAKAANRALLPEEQKKISALNETMLRQLAEIVLNSLAKRQEEFRYNMALTGEAIVADRKAKQNLVMSIFDMGEMLEIIDYAFKGGTVVPGFQEKK